MFFHEDWLLRQIEMMVEAILNAICNKQSQVVYEENFEIQQKISDLLKENKICEAENYIFELADLKKNDYSYFKIVLDFYITLSNMSEEDLNKYNFSHQEIRDGLISFCSYYKDDDDIKQLLDTFDLAQCIEKDNSI